MYVFDASAKVNAEPAQSNAFLIVTSCRNPINYAQTEQRNILRYVIPSYTLQELSLYSGYFGVGLKELAARCFEIGPSFYIIVGNDYAQIKQMTEAKANSISADQLERYVDNNFFQCADSGDISAGLMKVSVQEEEYEDPNDAYLDKNAIWEIASQHLCKIILSNAKSRLAFHKGKIFDVECMGFVVGNHCSYFLSSER